MTHAETRVLRQRAAAAVVGGATVQEVSAAFKRPRQWVRDACDRHGVTVPEESGLSPASPTTYSIIADLMFTHKSFTAIGIEQRVSKQRVDQIHKACVAAGIPVHPRPKGLSPTATTMTDGPQNNGDMK